MRTLCPVCNGNTLIYPTAFWGLYRDEGQLCQNCDATGWVGKPDVEPCDQRERAPEPVT